MTTQVGLCGEVAGCPPLPTLLGAGDSPYPVARARWYCVSAARLRRCRESSMLAANAFAPNRSSTQPHQPGGKMNSQPYWTRQLVASMAAQEMWGFICKPNGKRACRPIW
jgi:hypothetical protein